ncbi:hypothetical protein AY599_02840 [Leptolyngbya valderiana BDU 20041]|nr:hypothetical protein AY599_02840 [Leptolyngbya valderiana BDU 20041]
MATSTQEQYTIRAKVFDLVPQFFIADQQGQMVGYCRQKLFRFKEEIVLYTDRTRESELLRIKARQIIDFGATYDVRLPNGQSIGSLRRKGLKSTFVRDEWLVLDEQGGQIGTLQEDSTFRALLRRTIDAAAAFMPQKFHLRDMAGREIAIFRQHFNPFVFKLGIAVLEDHDQLDDLMLIAIGVLTAIIEGRQRD